jgi:hypothetical protein
MFTIYLDDSGSDPLQHVAIATAFIIPHIQIARLEGEWDGFRQKHGFSSFHTSEFVAKNGKSKDGPWDQWDEGKRNKVFGRVRQIAKKYGTRAVSMAVNKAEYDEVVPEEFRNYLGKHHYTWAVRQVIAWIDKFSVSPPRRWVFDSMGKPKGERRIEIEDVMQYAGWLARKAGVTGDYLNYEFRSSKDTPGLQCTDAISWVCYQKSLSLFRGIPTHPFSEIGWTDFGGPLAEHGWLAASTILRDNLQRMITREIADGRAFKAFEDWSQAKDLRA